MKQILVSIYLDKKRGPVVKATLSSIKQLDFFKEQLNDESVAFIEFYEIIIKKSNISHITIKEI